MSRMTLAISLTLVCLLPSCRGVEEESAAVDANPVATRPARDPLPPAEGSTMSPNEITIRAPGAIVAHPPPTTGWLTSGPWNVLYSSLPLWKTSRNIRITYKALPPSSSVSSAGETDRLDDLVEYQNLDSDKLKTVRGVDKASDEVPGWAWDWRGSGWLMIASSHWEVLGYGSLEVGAGSVDWAVTYFAKTLFTPAGIDIYSRPHATIPEPLLVEIKRQLKASGDDSLRTLVDELFLVKHDAG